MSYDYECFLKDAAEEGGHIWPDEYNVVIRFILRVIFFIPYLAYRKEWRKLYSFKIYLRRLFKK